MQVQGPNPRPLPTWGQPPLFKMANHERGRPGFLERTLLSGMRMRLVSARLRPPPPSSRGPTRGRSARWQLGHHARAERVESRSHPERAAYVGAANPATSCPAATGELLPGLAGPGCNQQSLTARVQPVIHYPVRPQYRWAMSPGCRRESRSDSNNADSLMFTCVSLRATIAGRPRTQPHRVQVELVRLPSECSTETSHMELPYG